MSQRNEVSTFEVKTILTVDDEGNPQAVTVENFGGIPHSHVRSIGQEAIDRFMGSSGHRFEAQLTPLAQEEDDVLVWEIRERISNRARAPITAGTETLL
jgi:hypothetical protein